MIFFYEGAQSYLVPVQRSPELEGVDSGDEVGGCEVGVLDQEARPPPRVPQVELPGRPPAAPQPFLADLICY